MAALRKWMAIQDSDKPELSRQTIDAQKKVSSQIETLGAPSYPWIIWPRGNTCTWVAGGKIARRRRALAPRAGRRGLIFLDEQPVRFPSKRRQVGSTTEGSTLMSSGKLCGLSSDRITLDPGHDSPGARTSLLANLR
jgi:hypothetical protein